MHPMPHSVVWCITKHTDCVYLITHTHSTSLVLHKLDDSKLKCRDLRLHPIQLYIKTKHTHTLLLSFP